MLILLLKWIQVFYLHRSGQNEVDVGTHISDSEKFLLLIPWWDNCLVATSTPPPHANKKKTQLRIEISSLRSPVSLRRENLTVVIPSSNDANALSIFCIVSTRGSTRLKAYLKWEYKQQDVYTKNNQSVWPKRPGHTLLLKFISTAAMS